MELGALSHGVELRLEGVVGIVVATVLYAALFRRELSTLSASFPRADGVSEAQRPPVPAWVTVTHLGFLAWTVWAAHYPVLFIGGFLFFVAFLQATVHHQTRLELRGPLLVGFFLAGLVIHGGLQGWWIAPVLSDLAPTALFWGATLLTAFNDNAAITYLATLVPGFTAAAKYAVVAGAVAGGGLTVIANAPNPAGLSVLQRFFPKVFPPLNSQSLRSCLPWLWQRVFSCFDLPAPWPSFPLAPAGLPRTLSAMGMFKLHADYAPTGDQPQAIAALSASLLAGNKHQTLLGVTGSGKTFTMANLIVARDRPTLIISHNKTLAAQLYSEFKNFFPENSVEYFVSHFDFYQPEAYVPSSDTFIEKDSSINEEIERLRIAASSALVSRRDVIVVASVSCIYGLGSPDDFKELRIPLERGAMLPRQVLLQRLVDNLYSRNDYEFKRGTFRVRGDVVDIMPAYLEQGLRVEFWGDEIEALSEFDPLTGSVLRRLDKFDLYPANQYVTTKDKLGSAVDRIKAELDARVAEFEKQGLLLEAQRIRMRTNYDLEMLQEMGFCNGIENYSRHLAGRAAGERPLCLLDFFPPEFLLLIDESHASVPQIGGMFNGDQARKKVLVNFGFRLPSALDNRPQNFDEFMSITDQIVYVSATPAKFELSAPR